MMSGFSEDRMMDEAINCGAIAKISKPFDLKSIIRLVESTLGATYGGGGGRGEACLYALFLC
jgi:hypothetical protein